MLSQKLTNSLDRIHPLLTPNSQRLHRHREKETHTDRQAPEWTAIYQALATKCMTFIDGSSSDCQLEWGDNSNVKSSWLTPFLCVEEDISREAR